MESSGRGTDPDRRRAEPHGAPPERQAICPCCKMPFPHYTGCALEQGLGPLGAPPQSLPGFPEGGTARERSQQAAVGRCSGGQQPGLPSPVAPLGHRLCRHGSCCPGVSRAPGCAGVSQTVTGRTCSPVHVTRSAQPLSWATQMSKGRGPSGPEGSQLPGQAGTAAPGVWSSGAAGPLPAPTAFLKDEAPACRLEREGSCILKQVSLPALNLCGPAATVRFPSRSPGTTFSPRPGQGRSSQGSRRGQCHWAKLAMGRSKTPGRDLSCSTPITDRSVNHPVIQAPTHLSPCLHPGVGPGQRVPILSQKLAVCVGTQGLT